jgi:hypothetical protein
VAGGTGIQSFAGIDRGKGIGGETVICILYDVHVRSREFWDFNLQWTIFTAFAAVAAFANAGELDPMCQFVGSFPRSPVLGSQR